MRTVLVILYIGLALNSFGQKSNNQVVLIKGQKFSVKTTSTQEADMGMGMEMKNHTSSENKFYVINANDKSYTISSTLTGIKISMDMMGQQANYDSDLKEDSASEIGKSITTLNIPDTLTVDKFSAETIANKKTAPDTKKDEETNPLEGLFESLGSQNADMALSEAFLIIPAGKKPGDSWVDSTSAKDMKTVRTYTIKSLDKNIAFINVVGNIEGNMKTEANGMQLTVTMSTKINSEITVNSKTSLVSKRDTKADITGNLEMMGQSLPITGKATTTSVYEY